MTHATACVVGEFAADVTATTAKSKNGTPFLSLPRLRRVGAFASKPQPDPRYRSDRPSPFRGGIKISAVKIRKGYSKKDRHADIFKPEFNPSRATISFHEPERRSRRQKGVAGENARQVSGVIV